MPHSSNNFDNARSWPFEEARSLIKRLQQLEKNLSHPKELISFQTGYGPSGLPHLGTFAEVLRTSMVAKCFELLTNRPTRLIVFSDDMDALRKIPDNIKNLEKLLPHLDKPLTAVPDIHGKYESFAHHNNAKLCEFLDRFDFRYEFTSSTDCYKKGVFDAALKQILVNYEKVMAKVLPTLGTERQASYSPFLPIDKKSGKIMQIPMASIDLDNDTIVFKCTDGSLYESSIMGGACKLQWKADWAMRWYALDIDYEMAGKDLIESVHLSGAITRIIGGVPPAGFSYELFLDEKGEKISKSKGNGMSMEEWLAYGGEESLAYFLFQKPRTAKRLYFDVIPKAVDDYNRMCEAFHTQEADKRLDNPVYHINPTNLNEQVVPISFQLLLNLASVLGNADADVMWKFVNRYADGLSPLTHPYLDKMIGYALAYCKDHVIPYKRYREASPLEQQALKDLSKRIALANLDSDTIQTIIFDIGKEYKFEPITTWFKACYNILFGQDQGPKLGTFVVLFGIDETRKLIADSLQYQEKKESL